MPVMHANPHDFIPSKRSYKKLGTILEHIIESINPYCYQTVTQVVNCYPLAVNIHISTIPNNNSPFPITVTTIPWVDKFDGKVYINPIALHENADW